MPGFRNFANEINAKTAHASNAPTFDNFRATQHSKKERKVTSVDTIDPERAAEAQRLVAGQNTQAWTDLQYNMQ